MYLYSPCTGVRVQHTNTLCSSKASPQVHEGLQLGPAISRAPSYQHIYATFIHLEVCLCVSCKRLLRTRTRFCIWYAFALDTTEANVPFGQLQSCMQIFHSPDPREDPKSRSLNGGSYKVFLVV